MESEALSRNKLVFELRRTIESSKYDFEGDGAIGELERTGWVRERTMSGGAESGQVSFDGRARPGFIDRRLSAREDWPGTLRPPMGRLSTSFLS